MPRSIDCFDFTLFGPISIIRSVQFPSFVLTDKPGGAAPRSVKEWERVP